MLWFVNENHEWMDWGQVAQNAIESDLALICDYPERLDWSRLCHRFKSWMLPLFQNHTEKLDYLALMQVRHCLNRKQDLDRFLLSNVSMSTLSKHTDFSMVEQVREHLNEVNWALSSRTGFKRVNSLIAVLPERVDWTALCRYYGPETLVDGCVSAERQTCHDDNGAAGWK